jgi:hypothetical protein
MVMKTEQPPDDLCADVDTQPDIPEDFTIIDLSKNAVLLDGTQTGSSTNRIRFVPLYNKNGLTNFSFRAWDKTYGSVGDIVDLTEKIGGTNAI